MRVILQLNVLRSGWYDADEDGVASPVVSVNRQVQHIAGRRLNVLLRHHKRGGVGVKCVMR